MFYRTRVHERLPASQIGTSSSSAPWSAASRAGSGNEVSWQIKSGDTPDVDVEDRHGIARRNVGRRLIEGQLHLPVFSGDVAVQIEQDGGVVEACALAFEYSKREVDAMAASNSGHHIRARPRHRLSLAIEQSSA